MPNVRLLPSAAGALALLVAAGALAWRAPSPPVVTTTATNAGAAVPDTVDGGYVTLRLRNRSDSLLAHGLVRLKPGVTPAEGVRAVRTMWRLDPGNPIAARDQFAGSYGGAVFVKPGADGDVGVALPPGDYVTYVDVVTERGPRVYAPFIRTLHVRASAGGAIDAPDHVVRLRDMRVAMPRTVRAGRARWRFENAGASWHLAFVGKLRPGRTYDEGVAYVRTHEGLDPFEPTETVVGVHALTPGLANDVTLDLAPGEYVVACPIEGHDRVGMVAPLTVTR